MIKSKRGRGRGGVMGPEMAAMAARQTGLLDAYTEAANTTTLTESDKFKEGYKKKGKGKTKDRPRLSESETDVPPSKEEPEPQPEPEREETWEEGVVESWEDIEATDIPLPSKVKQEMRKQEKQRKKQEQDRLKAKKEDQLVKTDTDRPAESASRTVMPPAAPMDSSTVVELASGMDQLTLSKNVSPKLKDKKVETSVKAAEKAEKILVHDGEPVQLMPIVAATETKPKKDLSSEEQAAIKAAREAQKAAKAAAKAAATQKKAAAASIASGGATPEMEAAPEGARKTSDVATNKPNVTSEASEAKIAISGGTGPEAEGGKSKAELKAERRAKQEAQRAAKAQAQETKTKAAALPKIRVPDEIQADQKKVEKKLARTLASQNLPTRTKAQRQVPLFSHLVQYDKENSVTKDLPLVGGNLHPAVIELGIQLAEGKVSSGEERSSQMLSALKRVIIDGLAGVKEADDTDIFKEVDTLLKPNINFLKQCRPLSISMGNALRAVKAKIKSSHRKSSMEETRRSIGDIFDEYLEENFTLAARQISISGGEMIKNGDVILAYSHSRLIEKLLLDAAKDKQFRVIVSDGRVQFSGRKLAGRLSAAGIHTTYILLTAVSQVLSSVTKVFMGCEGVMANGCVLGEVGTSQVALLAQSGGKPVLVCCETYKFTERVQTDSFVYNELSDPDNLVRINSSSSSALESWRENESLCLLNLVYDVTPASLVTAVITELSVIPTTSVPVILRLKHTEGHLVS